MAVGSMTAGLLADALIARGLSVTRARKAIQSVAFLIPAAALAVLANPAISPRAAVACLTVALGTTSLGARADSPLQYAINPSDISVCLDNCPGHYLLGTHFLHAIHPCKVSVLYVRPRHHLPWLHLALFAQFP